MIIKGESMKQKKEELQENINIVCNCKHCGHSWIKRTLEKPKVCPKCKSYNYDKDKVKVI